MVVLNKMEQNRLDKEKMMLSNIEKNINSTFFINILRNNWNKNHSIYSIGNLIGELYLHHIIHKDGFGFEKYITQINELYTQLEERKISPQNFETQKSKLIANVIADKLNIDYTKEIKEEDIEMVKNYFLKEYITYGYVSHSFPDAYYTSIIQNGLIPNAGDRKGNPQDIEEIQAMFMKRKIMAPLGSYPYYGGTGIYYEHDFTKVFQHAIDSPEWFDWFTSADHTSAYHNDIRFSPYILRNEEACRQNVCDLCKNADLSELETQKVIRFYQEFYNKFSSPKLNVALIPKQVVGKDNIARAVNTDMDLISTITYVLKDGSKEYTEHQGNVCMKKISPEKFQISNIPSPAYYITENNYFRESKEHLTDPNANFIILQNVEKNNARLIPSMKDKVEKVKPLIESKINMPNEQSIRTLNTYQKESTKKKVRTLKPNLPSNGYVNTILLALLVTVLISLSLLVLANMRIK